MARNGDVADTGRSWRLVGGAAALAAAALLHGCGGDVPSTTVAPQSNCNVTRLGPCSDCTEDGEKCVLCEFGYSFVNGRCGWTASSGRVHLEVNKEAMTKKGLTLDDTTFRYCSEKIPMSWPATGEPVTSIRLFKSWQSDWEPERKEMAWQHIRDFANLQNAAVLLGTQITCDEKLDDQDWEDTKSLMKVIGRERIMGLAVGNEMELLYAKKGIEPACIQNMWLGGYFWRKFKDRVADLDEMGFTDVKLTTVMGGYVFAGTATKPFLENPKQALFNSWLMNATADAAIRERFVFSLNIYGYFDTGAQLDPGPPPHTCGNALRKSLCFGSQGSNCYFNNLVRLMRKKMAKINVPGTPGGGSLWIGETGWSSPRASTLDGTMRWCDEWSSAASFNEYYKNFLTWDGLTPGTVEPEHTFYFTTRDSMNFGIAEGFGLIGGGDPLKFCELTQAKIANSSLWTTTNAPPPTTPYVPPYVPTPAPTPPPPPAPTPPPPGPGGCIAHWGNCAGGKTCCDGWICDGTSEYYRQCKMAELEETLV